MDDLIAIIKFTIPALVVFATSYLLLKSYLDNDYKKRLLDAKQSTQKEILPLRLQAYERMTLFLERISPTNLLHRTYKPNMKAIDLHQMLVRSIKLEYDHNLSQQIYVSPETWQLIFAVKEEMINLVNRVSAKIEPTEQAQKLSKKILQDLLNSKQVLPTQKALDAIKAEVHTLF